MVIPLRSNRRDDAAKKLCVPGRTVSYAVLEAIQDLVHPIVPCLGGGNDMPLIEAAAGLEFVTVFPRSEAGVGFIGNGIAWESGLATLCIVITSGGVYGMIQALYAAYVNRRPLIVLSGEVGGVGRGSVQAGDGWDGPAVTRVTRPLTAWSIDAPTASLAKRAVFRGVRLAAAERRPVHVNIPLSVQKELCP